MIKEIEFEKHLIQYVNHLNRIIKKIQNFRDLEDEDRAIIKAALEAYLKMDKEL